MKPLFDTQEPAPTSTPSMLEIKTDVFNLSPTIENTLAVQAPKFSLSALPAVKEEEIDQLGAQSAVSLSQVPNKLMSSIRAADADEFGAELNQLVVVAKGLDPEGMQNKGFLSKAFSFMSSTKEKLMSQYNSVEKQMDVLVVELEKKAVHHKSRIKDLEDLYVANVAYHQDLESAANRGEKLAGELRAALASSGAPTTAFEAQQLAEVERSADRIEKRVDDLRRAMLLAKQTAPQIRQAQDNARALVQKFGDVKTLTLPAWKNTFSLYIVQLEQKKAVGVLNAVDDATDAALRRGADLLRQNTEEIARARARSVVSIETLQHVQTQLLGAVDDMRRIDEEGKTARKAAAPLLLDMERELIAKFAPGQR